MPKINYSNYARNTLILVPTMLNSNTQPQRQRCQRVPQYYYYSKGSPINCRIYSYITLPYLLSTLPMQTICKHQIIDTNNTSNRYPKTAIMPAYLCRLIIPLLPNLLILIVNLQTLALHTGPILYLTLKVIKREESVSNVERKDTLLLPACYLP